MGFNFGAIKTTPVHKEIVKTAHGIHNLYAATDFINYYNSKEYQEKLNAYFQRVDYSGEKHRYPAYPKNNYNDSPKNYSRKLLIYLDEQYNIYCYGVIFIIDEIALELLTFSFDYVSNNITFCNIKIDRKITCLPPTLHKLCFYDCVFDYNFVLYDLHKTIIDQLVIENCIGLEKLENPICNTIRIIKSDIKDIHIHHNYSLNLLYIDATIDQADELHIDIDIPYLGGINLYNSYNLQPIVKCDLHNTNISIIDIKNCIISNKNKWTTAKIMDLRCTYCSFESWRAFNFHTIEHINKLELEQCRLAYKYLSADLFLSYKDKKCWPKHIYGVYVNTHGESYKDCGYILVRKKHNDYPLRILYNDNDFNELSTSYWADLCTKCQKHIHDFNSMEFVKFDTLDNYRENGTFIKSSRWKTGIWVIGKNPETGKDYSYKAKELPHKGNKLIGNITDESYLYTDISNSYYQYKVKTEIKQSGKEVV